MNKNIMMTVLLMIGVGFGQVEASQDCSYKLYDKPTIQSITFKNNTKNQFTFEYKATEPVPNDQNTKCYTPPNTDQGVDLKANETQELKMTSNGGKFSIKTTLKGKRIYNNPYSNYKLTELHSVYNFSDFNSADTYPISLKGGKINVYDGNNNPIKPLAEHKS